MICHVIITILLLSVSTSSSSPLNEDLLGLIVLKSSLADPTSALSTWTEDSPSPCSFPFVTCSPTSPHVTSLHLSNLSLSGHLSRAALLSLPLLSSLSLSSNRLVGPIPNDLLSLPHLRHVDISSNLLAGPISPFLLRCGPLLRSLDLSENSLVGPIPDSVSSCGALVSLNLSSNRLSGALPEALSALSSLKRLDLSRNGFGGPLPEWIGELRFLRELDLRGNRFSGTVPNTIRKLSLAKRLHFSENELTGTIPEAMRELRRLEEVDFSGNGFVGGVPWWVFENGLRKFSAARNRLEGYVRFPDVYKRSVAVLDLSGNLFYGWIPGEIGELTELRVLNLSGNSFSGSVPAGLGGLKNVEVVDLSRNSLGGEIPGEIGSCISLTSLKLSRNNLSGRIPPSLANLASVRTIDLSVNRLGGPVPSLLAKLPHLVSLNISHNLLSGALPTGGFFDSIPLSALSSNPGLCGPHINRSCSSSAVLPKPLVLNPNSSKNPHTNSSLASPNARHSKIILSISALVAISAAAFIALGVVVIVILNAHARSATSASAAALTVLSDESSSCASPEAAAGKLVMFTGEDPELALGARAILNKDTELGRGGFGAVYKTALRDGRPVAIKKLTVSSLVKSQEDFEKEIKKLGKIKHPNLVRLNGYYWTPSLQLLVYEYLAGGTLHRALHESSLTWTERFDVILGTARGLAHLHRHNIIHYNLKSSNVLIDATSGEVKIGDYGLAKLLPMLDRYVLSSKVQSALGYMAPEFACRSVKITEKCDVYGFGVLVLEVVTGRKPVEYTEDDVVVLCDVVRGAVERGRIEECVDARFAEEAVPVVKLGLICTSQVPSNRPEMGEVVKILEMIKCPQECLSSS